MLPSATGSISPHIAIRVIRPSVFKVTVLPPVLGPVMTSVLNSFPKLTSIGTTFCGSISGWRAFFRSISPVSKIFGTVAFIL